MTQTPQTPAGWYPVGGEERWWDGNQWSDHRRPLQNQAPQAPPADYGTTQPAYGAQPGYGAGYPAPAYGAVVPVKSNTTRNVLIALGIFFLLVVGGCFAVIAAAGKAVDTAVDSVTANDKLPGGADNPLTITPGEGFDVYGFTYASGWTVSADTGGLVDIAGLTVTSNRDDADFALVEIKFLRGNVVLALSDCTSDNQISPGTTVELNCFSGDPLPTDYDKVTINDSF